MSNKKCLFLLIPCLKGLTFWNGGCGVSMRIASCEHSWCVSDGQATNKSLGELIGRFAGTMDGFNDRLRKQCQLAIKVVSSKWILLPDGEINLLAKVFVSLLVRAVVGDEVPRLERAFQRQKRWAFRIELYLYIFRGCL